MKAIKKIVAVAVAAVSIGAMGVTASAEAVHEMPLSWSVIYQIGAPTSVNKQYAYTVNGSSTGYKFTCSYFNGGDDSALIVTTSNGDSFKFTKPDSYIVSCSNIPVTFTIRISGSSANLSAGGTIDYA